MNIMRQHVELLGALTTPKGLGVCEPLEMLHSSCDKPRYRHYSQGNLATDEKSPC